MDNQDYFKYLSSNPEGIVDPLYYKAVDRKVITDKKGETNPLIEANEKVIRYISSYQTLVFDLKKSTGDGDVNNLVELIIEALSVSGMNYSPFCQYFNVHNMNYSIFQNLENDKKIEFLNYILKHYIQNRHSIYLSHGYSNIVLQCFSDNYSHKRKGKYGTNKIYDVMKINGIYHISNVSANSDIYSEMFFILPDTNGNDKNIFHEILRRFNIKFQYLEDKHKYPDALVKIGDHILIVEQKNMKEDGGGQDKQTVEIIDFIKHSENNPKVHYVTFVDGIYANKLIPSATSKTLSQYTDVVTALAKNKANYFTNSFGFSELIQNFIIDHNYEKLSAVIDQ